jgi:hypothetical protein
MRATHPCERASKRSPGSRTESFCTCQVLRPRRAAGTRENAPSSVAFHVVDRVGSREFLLTRLNTWPALSPTDASPQPHGWTRTAWGQCGSLFLHCSGLSPPTLCRSPGAPTGSLTQGVLRASLSRTLRWLAQLRASTQCDALRHPGERHSGWESNILQRRQARYQRARGLPGMLAQGSLAP